MEQGMGTGVNNIPALSSANLGTERGRRPVFVIGCHRSGTNLLYDMLLSAGGFAVYSGYLPFHKIFVPRFGHPRNMARRRKIVLAFMRSKGFARTGLDAADLSAKLLEQGKTAGDFIRIVMDEVAHQQGVSRWAVYDPDDVLHMRRVKSDLPDALFVHIIRDGRDIALSLRRMGGFRPFPWDRRPRSLIETALYWQWIVRAGRRLGHSLPGDYMEIRYESLVSQPYSVLEELGRFLHHDLDYDRIQATGLGRLRKSNSSFLNDADGTSEHPVNRWKQKLSPHEITEIEAVIGATLEEFGYPLMTTRNERRLSLRRELLAAAYPRFLDAKLWLKLNTWAGRFADISALELSDSFGNEI